MRTSHIKIRKRIDDEKSKITDRELFLSPEYSAYLTDITEAASKRYKQTVKIIMYWDEDKNAGVAATDNDVIAINAGNFLTRSFQSRTSRAESLIGLDAHEVGHILFSDFVMLEEFLTALEAGRMYPSEPSCLSTEDKASLNEIKILFALKNKNAVKIISKATKNFQNILEDIYIEARMCEAFPGSFRRGILLNNLKMTELAQTVTEQINDGLHGLSIMTNLLIQYCRAGKINNPEGYEGEYLDSLNECIPVADSAVYDSNVKTRFSAANLIAVKLWKYIKPLTDKADDDIIDKLLSELSGQIISVGSDPSGKGTPLITGDFQFDKDALERAKEEAQKSYGDEEGYSSGKDMNSVLTGIAESKVNNAMEKALLASLRSEAKRINYGDIHKKVRITVNRMQPVPEDLVELYKAVSPPLLTLSKRMQKQVEQILKDKREGGKQRGLITGKRLDARALVNNDGRFFYNTRLPQERQELSVAVLVDESGSMRSDGRIGTARDACIVIYDFCMKLNIPVIIYGHTTEDNIKDVELYAYAECESRDKNDMYRLMDMAARSCNRDGAALRFVAERLVKRPEEFKLLIIISDGQPYAEDYYGEEAEADLRGIKHEYKKKGVITVAAAIGDDKDNIKRIYNDGFLDITDLNRLPSNLASLISKYIKDI